MAPKARYALQEVFQLIEDGRAWFSARPRSTEAVIKAYASTGKNKSVVEAEAFILRAIKSLTALHFCESVLQWNDSKCIADVYGFIYDDRSWYVKFRINREEEDQPFLDQISFHPPENEMETVGGALIPKGV